MTRFTVWSSLSMISYGLGHDCSSAWNSCVPDDQTGFIQRRTITKGFPFLSQKRRALTAK